jgi:predicted transcriptional regulator
MGKTTRIIIRIEPELKEELVRMAQESDRSLSSMARSVIKQAVEDYAISRGTAEARRESSEQFANRAVA